MLVPWLTATSQVFTVDLRAQNSTVNELFAKLRFVIAAYWLTPFRSSPVPEPATGGLLTALTVTGTADVLDRDPSEME